MGGRDEAQLARRAAEDPERHALGVAIREARAAGQPLSKAWAKRLAAWQAQQLEAKRQRAAEEG